jgi:hypothetical protein
VSRSFDGSNEFFSHASNPIGGSVMTLAAWFKVTVIPPGGTLGLVTLGVSGQGGTNSHRVCVASDGAIIARCGGFTQANSSTVVTDLGWHHAASVRASPTDRRAFLDGGGKGSNATSVSITPTDLRLGQHMNGQERHNGQLAHVAGWNVALTDDEIAMLGAGRLSPLMVRPASLKFYFPYLGRDAADVDVMGGLTLSMTGTVDSVAEEPPILWLHGKRRIFLPATSAPAPSTAGPNWFLNFTDFLECLP